MSQHTSEVMPEFTFFALRHLHGPCMTFFPTAWDQKKAIIETDSREGAVPRSLVRLDSASCKETQIDTF